MRSAAREAVLRVASFNDVSWPDAVNGAYFTGCACAAQTVVSSSSGQWGRLHGNASGAVWENIFISILAT